MTPLEKLMSLTISILLLAVYLPVFVGISSAQAEPPGFDRKCSHSQFLSNTTAKGSNGNWYQCSGSDISITKSGEAKRYYFWVEKNDPTAEKSVNVKPGQGCTKFKRVVESKNYGSLTCKLVWIGKIKALVWART